MEHPRIEGADKVIQWFGCWPVFHDCHIAELRLSGGDCILSIEASEMTSEVDANGVFKLAKHCTVAFHFRDVSDLQLTTNGPLGTIIFEMEWEQPADESVAVRWDSSIGLEGTIRARTCRVEIAAR